MNRRIKLLLTALGAAILVARAAPAVELEPRPNSEQIAAIRAVPPGGDFNFVVMGDVQGSERVFPALVRLAADMDADFIIVNGDVVENGTAEEFELYLDQVRESRIPLISGIGNHELLAADGYDRFVEIFGPVQFAFDVGGWRILVFDTGDYEVTAEELAWLDAELGQSCPRCVVVTHTPPVQERWYQSFTKGAKEFEALLARRSVPYAFFGHMHLYDRLEKSGVRYVVSGGAGGAAGIEDKLNPLYFEGGGPFHHFMFVRVSGDEISDVLVRPFIEPEEHGGIALPGARP